MIKDKITYLTSFSLYSPFEVDLLCNYKYFIENTIMKLGEDWRIQSNLLAQEIISIKSKAQPDKDFTEFNLFNEFLSAFLKGKIGKEFQFCNYQQSEIQEQFLETVSSMFVNEEKIQDSLTFKTLTLGYCITATDVWNRTFKNLNQKISKHPCNIKPFVQAKIIATDSIIKQNDGVSLGTSTVRRKIENIDLLSNLSEVEMNSEKKEYNAEMKVQWSESNEQQQITAEELNAVKATFTKIQHKLTKAHVLSHFVAYVDEFHLKTGKYVRVITISGEFYLMAFVIWLIFNIKMFFSLNFVDYKRFFQMLIGDRWNENFERPLKKFQIIIQREWNKLLKDYTVALHDDIEVLHILIQRIKKEIQIEWDSRIDSLKEVIKSK